MGNFIKNVGQWDKLPKCRTNVGQNCKMWEMWECGTSVQPDLSRSGDKIVSTKSNNIDRNIKTLSNNFLSERVISFWNKLPSFVRNSVSVNDFKINLEEFKKTNNLVDTGNFWEVSNIVLAKIEGVNYIEKKKQQVQYLYKNPCVAKRKGINIS